MADDELFIGSSDQSDIGNTYLEEPKSFGVAMVFDSPPPARTVTGPMISSTKSVDVDSSEETLNDILKEKSSKRKPAEIQAVAHFVQENQIQISLKHTFAENAVKNAFGKGDLSQTSLYKQTMRKCEDWKRGNQVKSLKDYLDSLKNGEGLFRGEYELRSSNQRRPSTPHQSSYGESLPMSASAHPNSMAPPLGTNSRQTSIASTSLGGHRSLLPPMKSCLSASTSCGSPLPQLNTDHRRPLSTAATLGASQQRVAHGSPLPQLNTDHRRPLSTAATLGASQQRVAHGSPLPQLNTDHRRPLSTAATLGASQQRVAHDSSNSLAAGELPRVVKNVSAHREGQPMDIDRSDEYPQRVFRGRGAGGEFGKPVIICSKSRIDTSQKSNIASHEDNVSYTVEDSRIEKHARRQAINRQAHAVQFREDELRDGGDAVKRKRLGVLQDDSERSEKRSRPAPTSDFPPPRSGSHGFTQQLSGRASSHHARRSGHGNPSHVSQPRDTGGNPHHLIQTQALQQDNSHSNGDYFYKRERGLIHGENQRYSNRDQVQYDNGHQEYHGGGNGPYTHPNVMPGSVSRRNPFVDAMAMDPALQKLYGSGGRDDETEEHSFIPKRQESYQIRPQGSDSTVGVGGSRTCRDPDDEGHASDQPGIPPFPAMAQRGYPAGLPTGDVHHGENSIYKQHGASSHIEMAHGDAQSADGSRAQGSGYASRPRSAVILATSARQSRPRPKPRASHNLESNSSSSQNGESDGDNEAPRQTTRRAPRASNAAENVVLQPIAVLSQAAIEARQAQINYLSNASARWNLTRVQEFVDLDEDRSLHMAIMFRQHIGYVPTVRSAQSTTSLSRRKISPLTMTRDQFYSLSSTMREKIARQKRQRDNLYVRACSMIMDIAIEEQTTDDMGPHLLIPLSLYHKHRVTGKSEGISNPDNVFAALEYEIFNSSFDEQADLLNCAYKFCRIKRKGMRPYGPFFGGDAIHNRFNRLGERMAIAEQREWVPVGKRQFVGVAAEDATKDDLLSDNDEVDNEPADDEPSSEFSDTSDEMLREFYGTYMDGMNQFLADRLTVGLNLEVPLTAEAVQRRCEQLGLGAQQPPQ